MEENYGRHLSRDEGEQLCSPHRGTDAVAGLGYRWTGTMCDLGPRGKPLEKKRKAGGGYKKSATHSSCTKIIH